MAVNLPGESELRNLLLKLDEDYLLGRITKKEYDTKKGKIEAALKLLRLEADFREGKISEEDYNSRQAALMGQIGDLSEIIPKPAAPAEGRVPGGLPSPEGEIEAAEAAPTPLPAPPREAPRPPAPERAEEIPSTLEGLVKELENLDAKRKKLSDLFRSGEISDETFVNMFLEYKSRREELVGRLKSVEGEVEERLSDLLSELEEIEGRLELLKARAALGEIDRPSYERERGRMEDRRREVEEELSLLRKALDRISGRG